jgi:xylulokinase
LIRATLEGICLNLRIALDILKDYTDISDDMLLVGGGGKSQFWRKLFADIFNKNIIESCICEDAGSFGAFVLAAVGVNIWNDFDRIYRVHTVENKIEPNKHNNAKYEKILPVYKKVCDMLSDAGDLMENMR